MPKSLLLHHERWVWPIDLVPGATTVTEGGLGLHPSCPNAKTKAVASCNFKHSTPGKLPPPLWLWFLLHEMAVTGLTLRQVWFGTKRDEYVTVQPHP